VDLTEYRRSSSERQRTSDLVQLMPAEGQQALDIGARDGHFSQLMAERFDRVTALDVTDLSISHARIHCIQGDAAALPFRDKSFDFVSAPRFWSYSCGQRNPPWGHVSTFDEQRLRNLFRECAVETISFVGVRTEQTNALAAALMDFAGNPFGTYAQEECCVHCGQRLLPPPTRSPAQRIATRLACWVRDATNSWPVR
jgi:SAM-dependent methyltransferase